MLAVWDRVCKQTANSWIFRSFRLNFIFAELHTIIDSAKPDIILGNESWLTPDIKNSEIFPDSFDAIRKDRVGDAHGGVFIAFRRDLLCTENPELDTECEIV